MRWTCGDGDAMANGDGVLPYQNVFDHESYDSLTLADAERLCGTTQAREECCDGFCQAQEYFPIVGLVSDRLQLAAKRLLALTQCRHALTQLLDRQQSFLVGVDESVDAITNIRSIPSTDSVPVLRSDRTSARRLGDGPVLVVSASGLPAIGLPQPRRSDRADPVG